ncbi:MAG: DUF4445 domain-containing protein, partial [Chitinivibrionales bacterium]|nr:DUF4445 domain-containing protein [Chitinivibrionales bacterium]MBD3355911.1 DUF4445 domain-containing protein [Chitinivibrionales bacterium]
ELFLAGQLNSAGIIRRDRTSSAVRIEGSRACYVLATAAESGTGRDIVVTEADIEKVLRAKAAVYSMTELLLKQIGSSVRNVAKVYLSGDFARHCNIERARVVGLVPDLPSERFFFLGNASLMGTRGVLLSSRHRRKQHDIAKRIKYVELSKSPSYMEKCTEALPIPHSDTALFPRVPTRRK